MTEWIDVYYQVIKEKQAKALLDQMNRVFSDCLIYIVNGLADKAFVSGLLLATLAFLLDPTLRENVGEM